MIFGEAKCDFRKDKMLFLNCPAQSTYTVTVQFYELILHTAQIPCFKKRSVINNKNAVHPMHIFVKASAQVKASQQCCSLLLSKSFP